MDVIDGKYIDNLTGQSDEEREKKQQDFRVLTPKHEECEWKLLK